MPDVARIAGSAGLAPARGDSHRGAEDGDAARGRIATLLSRESRGTPSFARALCELAVIIGAQGGDGATVASLLWLEEELIEELPRAERYPAEDVAAQDHHYALLRLYGAVLDAILCVAVRGSTDKDLTHFIGGSLERHTRRLQESASKHKSIPGMQFASEWVDSAAQRLLDVREGTTEPELAALVALIARRPGAHALLAELTSSRTDTKAGWYEAALLANAAFFAARSSLEDFSAVQAALYRQTQEATLSWKYVYALTDALCVAALAGKAEGVAGAAITAGRGRVDLECLRRCSHFSSSEKNELVRAGAVAGLRRLEQFRKEDSDDANGRSADSASARPADRVARSREVDGHSTRDRENAHTDRADGPPRGRGARRSVEAREDRAGADGGTEANRRHEEVRVAEREPSARARERERRAEDRAFDKTAASEREEMERYFANRSLSPEQRAEQDTALRSPMRVDLNESSEVILLQRMLAVLRRELEASRNEKLELEKTIDALNGDLAKAAERARELTERAADTEGRLEGTKQAMTEQLARHVREVQVAAEVHEMRVRENEQDRETLRTLYDDSRARADGLEDANERLLSLNAALQEDLNQSNQLLNDLETDYRRLEADLAATESSRAALEDGVRDLDAAMTEIQSRQDGQRREFEERERSLEAEKLEAEKELLRCRAALDSMRAEHATAAHGRSEERSLLALQASALQSEHESLRKEFDIQHTELGKVSEDYRAMEGKVLSLVASHAAVLDDMQTRQAALQRKLDRAHEDTAVLEQRLMVACAELEASREELAGTRREAESLKELRNVARTECDGLSHKTTAMTTEIERLQEQLLIKASECDEVTICFNAERREAEALRLQCEQQAERLARQDTAVADLQAELASVREELQSLEAAHQTIQQLHALKHQAYTSLSEFQDAAAQKHAEESAELRSVLDLATRSLAEERAARTAVTAEKEQLVREGAAERELLHKELEALKQEAAIARELRATKMQMIAELKRMRSMGSTKDDTVTDDGDDDLSLRQLGDLRRAELDRLAGELDVLEDEHRALEALEGRPVSAAELTAVKKQAFEDLALLLGPAKVRDENLLEAHMSLRDIGTRRHAELARALEERKQLQIKLARTAEAQAALEQTQQRTQEELEATRTRRDAAAEEVLTTRRRTEELQRVLDDKHQQLVKLMQEFTELHKDHETLAAESAMAASLGASRAAQQSGLSDEVKALRASLAALQAEHQELVGAHAALIQKSGV